MNANLPGLESLKTPFHALVTGPSGEALSSRVCSLPLGELARHAPEGADVLVRVACSSLNYKDGLALSGKNKIVKSYPHVAGVDFAGVVERSNNSAWREGDKVIATGFRLGEDYWGGFASHALLRGDWLVGLPASLSLSDSMAIGTAGLTAMECIIRLEEAGITPEKGVVLVSGAGGGVGSLAVSVLAALGYRVAAVSGRAELGDYLRSLGACAIIPRDELKDPPAKPLQEQRWAGAVDTVGGVMLGRILSHISFGGAVAATGLAGGVAFPGDVRPFILRGVSLLGVESVMLSLPRRRTAWERLARDLPRDRLGGLSEHISLSQVGDYAARILKGEVRGRVVVDIGNFEG